MNDHAPTPRTRRLAIYFSPQAGSAWSLAGAHWLGRCVDAGGATLQPELEGWDPAEFAALTAEPRRYGWHATLKAPFRLAADRDEATLRAALDDLAARRAAFDLPPLEVAEMGDFLALRPVADCAPLQALAGCCVTELHRFAAPLTDAEIAQRRSAGLTPQQDALLLRWGYPYVLDGFRFHLTLTGRLGGLTPQRVASLRAQAQEFFAALPQPLRIDALSLFAEPDRGAGFTRVARSPLAA